MTSASPYTSELVDLRNEDKMQEAIAKQPTLLDPCLVPGTLPGWLLVSREFTFPAGLASSSSNPLDVLFLDALGTPTLVESKLGYTATTRREVVGQVVGYFSAATLQDSTALIRRTLLERCSRLGCTPEEAISAAFAGSIMVSEFWLMVSKAFSERRFRVVFAFDRIPGALARATQALDFLMPTVSVHALEVAKRRVADGICYSSERIIVDRWRPPPQTAARRASSRSDAWEGIAVDERRADTVRLPQARTRLVPLPIVFRLEASSKHGARDQHQVDPSRPASHIAVMPNLELLAAGKNPYPAALPDPTVRPANERWVPWVHIAYVTWERLVSNGEVVHPRDVDALLNDAARRAPILLEDKDFRSDGGSAVLDALRDLQLYGLCRAFRRGQSRRFLRSAGCTGSE